VSLRKGQSVSSLALTPGVNGVVHGKQVPAQLSGRLFVESYVDQLGYESCQRRDPHLQLPTGWPPKA
jgi:hypothetical protein